MKHPFIGRAAKLMMSSKCHRVCISQPANAPPVPVVRAADMASSGTGRIVLSDDDPLLVIGIATKFTDQVKSRSTLVLPKTAGYATAEVAEVISDTELRYV
jgi:hypothetical protein